LDESLIRKGFKVQSLGPQYGVPTTTELATSAKQLGSCHRTTQRLATRTGADFAAQFMSPSVVESSEVDVSSAQSLLPV
ncbi:hypothetical protein PO002_45955, partial [Cupriavidus necator]|uniref:hypothetical protein n=1 Tax=Cupriavidus necator TaxID=106590 RepID=UPI0039C154DA